MRNGENDLDTQTIIWTNFQSDHPSSRLTCQPGVFACAVACSNRAHLNTAATPEVTACFKIPRLVSRVLCMFDELRFPKPLWPPEPGSRPGESANHCAGSRPELATLRIYAKGWPEPVFVTV